MRQENAFIGNRPGSIKKKKGMFNGSLLNYFTILVLIGLMILGSTGKAIASSTPRRATIISLIGSVLIQNAGQAIAVPARKNMELKSGDRIITGNDATCEIRFDDGSISRIGPESRIDISFLQSEGDGVDTTIMNAHRGSVWNNAKEIVKRNSRFEVNTPAAVASVRGTNFLVRVQSIIDTLVRVYQGQVGLSAASEEPEDGDGASSPPILTKLLTYVNSFQQATFTADATPPAAAEDVNVLDVDDFEKDNLVSDQPEAYVLIETEVKTILLDITGERLQEELKNLALITKELELLDQLLDRETNPEKIRQLQLMQQKMQNEKSIRQELAINLEKERQVLTDEKEKFTQLKGKMERLTPEQLKEEAKDLREEEKAHTSEQQVRQQQITQQEQNATETRTQLIQQGEELGVKDTLQQAESLVTPELIQKLAQEVLPAQSEQTETQTQIESPSSTQSSDSGSSSTKYSLTLNVYPTPGGTVSGSGSYRQGRSVTLNAIPATGYSFVNWMKGDAVVSTDAEFNYTMPSEAVTMIANFEKIVEPSFTVCFAVYDKDEQALEDTLITFNGITNGAGDYIFKNISPGTYEYVISKKGYETVKGELTVLNNSINKAITLQSTYFLTLEVAPPNGGTVSGAGDYTVGEKVQISATAAEGYKFVNWTTGGFEIATVASYVYTMSAEATTLVANFDEIYTISVSTGEGGTVAGGGCYTYGSSVTLTATPVTGYEFVKWTENGQEVSRNESYSFSAYANRILVAHFKKLLPTGEVQGTANFMDKETHEGISILLVGYDAEGKRFEIRTNTGQNGTFLLTGIPKGSYTITASYADYYQTSKVLTVQGGDVVVLDQVLKLYPEQSFGSLQGYAKYLYRENHEGIYIRVQTLAGEFLPDLVALTDASGYFCFEQIPVDSLSGVSSYIVTAYALDAQQELASDSIQVTIQAGEEYTTISETLWVRAAANNVIIFADNTEPWESSALLEMLGMLEVNYSLHSSSGMATLSLPIDSTVWIINDQPQEFYNSYADNQQRFIDFVQQGGTLLFEACDQGWEEGSLKEAGGKLPGGVENALSNDYYNSNVNPTHPMMTHVPAELFGNYASHNYFVNLPVNATILCTDSQDNPTLVEYKYGQGRVIATGQPLEYHWQYGYNPRQIYANMIFYTFNLPATVIMESYGFTLQANPETGGAVIDNTNFGPYAAEGASINVEAISCTGYKFVNWTVDGVEVSLYPLFNFPMPAADTVLVANFIEDREVPVFAEGYPRINATCDSVELAVQLNEDGTGYSVMLPALEAGELMLTAEQIKAWNPEEYPEITSSWTDSFPINADEEIIIQNYEYIYPETTYKIYFFAEDPAGNMTNVQVLEVTTDMAMEETVMPECCPAGILSENRNEQHNGIQGQVDSSEAGEHLLMTKQIKTRNSATGPGDY